MWPKACSFRFRFGPPSKPGNNFGSALGINRHDSRLVMVLWINLTFLPTAPQSPSGRRHWLLFPCPLVHLFHLFHLLLNLHAAVAASPHDVGRRSQPFESRLLPALVVRLLALRCKSLDHSRHVSGLRKTPGGRRPRSACGRMDMCTRDAGDIHRSTDPPSGGGRERDFGLQLLSYTSGTIHIHGYHAVARGLRFAAPDPSTGDASISIAPLSPAHSATYRCQVRKSPGVDTRKVTLVVMDVVTGELRITNHSESHAGFYRCEAHNAAGARHCGVRLKAERRKERSVSPGSRVTPPNGAAILVGRAVGSLLFIFVLLVFIGILYWKLSDRRRYFRKFDRKRYINDEGGRVLVPARHIRHTDVKAVKVEGRMQPTWQPEARWTQLDTAGPRSPLCLSPLTDCSMPKRNQIALEPSDALTAGVRHNVGR
ncbi:Coxsackievirus and adenovirus receptor [Liparis tanakae]|uniref:Coxsackievirus and adenovirus receptor n=1 Tax=Liparis tanakae TaxID=230148 RepID=A0A4Z2GS75_9TELE|nr:Coxsackievirus and adenovirus receptor [Liparis tanakae]